MSDAITPRFLCLDTNIVLPFPASLDHPLLQILIDISRKWEFEIYVPEVSYLEWLNNKRKDIYDEVDRIERSAKKLRDKYLLAPSSLEKISGEDIYARFKEELDQSLKKRGINIIETGDVEIGKLIEMSVQKIEPFEEKGEKGFRDSVILFSILNHAKKFNNRCFFITNDSIYGVDAVQKIAKEKGIGFHIFKSIESFKETFEKIEEKLVQSVIEERRSKLEQFLLSKRDMIEKFLKESAQFDLVALNLHIRSQQLDYAVLLALLHKGPPRVPISESVKKINNIELLGIRASSLPVGENKEQVPIYFSINLRLSVTIERSFMPFSDKRISLKGVEYIYNEPSTESEIYDTNMEVEFPLYASILKKEDEYFDLTIKEIGQPIPPQLSKLMAGKDNVKTGND